MQIMIGICTDDARKISKTMQNSVTLTVHAKEPLDVLAPVFYLEYDPAYINYNYCKAFGKCYFMEPSTEPGKAMRLQCREDVLATYAADILVSRATAIRSYSQYDGKFQDPKYPVIQRKSIETVPLFSMSESESIIFGWIE